MNTLTFTPAELAGYIIVACSAIITISGAITVIVNWYNRKKEPDKIQNERLLSIEKRLARHDDILDSYKERLNDIDERDSIILQSLLALLSHGIDGNDVAAMKSAKDQLQHYLINRKK